MVWRLEVFCCSAGPSGSSVDNSTAFFVPLLVPAAPSDTAWRSRVLRRGGSVSRVRFDMEVDVDSCEHGW